MALRHSTAFLLPLLLLIATAMAERRMLANLDLRHESEMPQDDLALPPGAQGPEQVASLMDTVEKCAKNVFPGSLWAAMPSWSSAPQDTPDTTDGYTHQQARGLERLNPFFIYYMPDTTNVSWACNKDVLAFYIELSRGTDWAWMMVDSWGKLPDGMSAGNTWASGMLDQCIDIRVDQELPQAHFKGQYCALTYKKLEEEEEETEENAPSSNLRMAGVAGKLGLAFSDNLYGTCIPSSCTREEYKEGLNRHLQERGLELQQILCQTEDKPSMEYNGADVTMIVVLSLLGVLVLSGTCVDLWTMYSGKKHEETGHLRYVLAFSPYTNLRKMFFISTQENTEVISCLHGIRVLTMSWVVLGHSYIMTISPGANKVTFMKGINRNPVPYQIIINGLLSVDTFFFMSGLLVAYNLTKEVARTGRFNIPLYYIHRFLRLAPPILLLCGILAVFPPLYVRGSLSPSLTEPGGMVDLCRRYWWRDSFFLTNWFFNEIDTESCIPVSWYLAVEFQLYIVTPLMFLPILYWRKPGAAWLGCLVLVSAVIPAIIIGVNELPPTQVMNVPYSKYYDYTKWVYTKPYCRASPYLVGLAMGYFMRQVDKEQVQRKLKWWQAVLGWLVALIILNCVLFGIPNYNDFSTGNQEYNAAVSITYGGLHRLAWGVSMAWIVFACHMGYGGPANSFLAHPFWQPLSRLTYTTFLIALNLQFIVFLYMPQIPVFYSDMNMVLMSTGIILLAGCFGVLLSLLAEAPVLGLEKIILRRGNRTVKHQVKEKAEDVGMETISDGYDNTANDIENIHASS